MTILAVQILSEFMHGYYVRLGSDQNSLGNDGIPVIIPRGQTLTISVDRLGRVIASFEDSSKSWGKVTLDFMGRQ